MDSRVKGSDGLVLHARAWPCPGGHVARRAEGGASSSEDSEWETHLQAASGRVLGPRPQGHAHSHKATPPDGATPWAEQMETITARGSMSRLGAVCRPRTLWMGRGRAPLRKGLDETIIV